MKSLAALVALVVCAAPASASAVEIFMFKAEGKSAVALYRDGGKLPPVQGGWTFTGSVGDHAGLLEEADLDRIRVTGFEVYEDRKPSKRVEDWVGMPRGSFRITKRAAAQIRLFYDHLVKDGTPQVLSLQYGPVSVKDKGSAQWCDLGDRITLGGYNAADVPKAAVRRYDGVPLLFLMDPEKLPKPKPRAIDYSDATGFVFVR